MIILHAHCSNKCNCMQMTSLLYILTFFLCMYIIILRYKLLFKGMCELYELYVVTLFYTELDKTYINIVRGLCLETKKRT